MCRTPADTPRVLIVDDERKVLGFLDRALTCLDLGVTAVETGREAVSSYAQCPTDLVLVDLHLEDMDGIEVVRQIREHDGDAAVIMMTGYGSVGTAVDAMKAGAADYLTKPLDMDHLEIVLNRVLQGRRQARELELFRSQLERQASFEGLLGVSAPMRRVYELIRRVAGSDVSIVIQGETGTGKELVAKAIHSLSERREAAYTPISCGALPESLLESELFGHERGAFTNAFKQKLGLIEQANQGTLFLDEIDEMSPGIQVKLLRAIQEREVLRVGGDRPIPVDFRLLAATNVDLRQRMEQGGFRADLFYRMSGMVLELPPLRVRKNDIPLLAGHFAARCAERSGSRTKEISPDVMMALASYHWPGNVRELENVIEQATLMCQGDTVELGDLPDIVVETSTAGGGPDLHGLPLRDARGRFERQYLVDVLRRAEGQVTEAARMAGINRQHFYQKMKTYGITRGKDEASGVEEKAK